MTKQKNNKLTFITTWKQKVFTIIDSFYSLFTAPVETEILIEVYGNELEIFSLTTFLFIPKPLTIAKQSKGKTGFSFLHPPTNSAV